VGIEHLLKQYRPAHLRKIVPFMDQQPYNSHVTLVTSRCTDTECFVTVIN